MMVEMRERTEGGDTRREKQISMKPGLVLPLAILRWHCAEVPAYASGRQQSACPNTDEILLVFIIVMTGPWIYPLRPHSHQSHR